MLDLQKLRLIWPTSTLWNPLKISMSPKTLISILINTSNGNFPHVGFWSADVKPNWVTLAYTPYSLNSLEPFTSVNFAVLYIRQILWYIKALILGHEKKVKGVTLAKKKKKKKKIWGHLKPLLVDC